MQHRTGIAVAQKTHGASTSARAPAQRLPAVAGGALVVLLAVVACGVSWAALGAQADTTEQLPAIMTTAEVRTGMRGYGLTTFEGAHVQRFDVEVLGVARGWSPKGNVVLVRMSGPVVDESGTVAGMSGSPIYINDKLLGAVAYGFPYCKIPLAGITPIEEMLVAGEIDKQAAPSDSGAQKAAAWRHLRMQSAAVLDVLQSGGRPDNELLSQALSRMVVPLCMQQRSRTYSLNQMPLSVRGLFQDPASVAMVPLPTPLAVGGVGAEAFSTLAPMLMTGGFVPVQAAAAAPSDGGEEIKIVPGAPVGAVLVSGDLDLAGMGTLTMVDGNRVLAFGHSMLSSGRNDLPLALGRVQSVVPSTYLSFRLTGTDRVIGRLTQDRESAIVGRLGEEALMFPCTVAVKGAWNGTFNYNIAGYWQVSPFLAFYAASASAERWEGTGSEFTVKATSRIRLKGRDEPIVLENLYVGYSPATPAISQVFLPLAILMLNPFQEVEIAGVEVEEEVEEGLRAARIESVRLGHQEVEPGGKVELFVKLREYRGAEQVRKLEIQVPLDAEPGSQAQILVADSLTERMMDLSYDPGLVDPKNLEELIAVIERDPPNTHIFARASFLKSGVRYEGEAMPELPSSVLAMLGAESESGVATPLIDDVKSSVETPWVIGGSQRVAVLIRKPGRVGTQY